MATQMGQNIPLAPEATQMIVQMTNGVAAPPACWTRRRWRWRRRSTSSALACWGEAGSRGRSLSRA